MADPDHPDRPDLRRPDHLPNLRAGRQPPHPSWLPRQRRGTTPQMIGRYPDFDVLDAAATWDDATAAVVGARLDPPGPLRFFTRAEVPTLRAFCDTVLAQDGEPRVPVAEMVDAKLADGRLDGYRYADMPDDRDTWRLVLAGLDHTARTGHRLEFAACDTGRRENIVGEFARARLVGGAWDELNVGRAWSVVMRATLAAFYSHPWAWNEIGFGGPCPTTTRPTSPTPPTSSPASSAPPTRRTCSPSGASRTSSAAPGWAPPRRQRHRRRPPRLGSAQRRDRRRVRVPHPGRRQPGVDDHGARRAARRPHERQIRPHRSFNDPPRAASHDHERLPMTRSPALLPSCPPC